MKKLLILLLFTNCISAQIDPTDYPIFDSCKDVQGDEMRNCFLDHLYDQMYLRLKEKIPTTDKFQSLQIFFAVDDQGEFTHLTNSATPETLSNTIAAAFKDLPRVKPARFLGEPASEKFGIILKIPLQRDGSLTEIITSAVPPPPPAPEIVSVVEDDVEIEEVIIEIEDPEVLSYTENMEVEETLDENEPEKVPFAIIEEVPGYPGCENLPTNAERRKCFSLKVTDFVRENFKTRVATKLGLQSRQLIRIQFTIDSQGLVTEIEASSKHPRLENEAERVIRKLPKMTPGKHRGKEVGVIYALPFIFNVED